MKKRLLPLLLAGLFLCCGTWAYASADGEPSGEIGEQTVNIGGLDLGIIVFYLVGIVALGCWAGTRRKEAKGSDYFLAGKSLKWPMIGLALFATNISTLHLVSFAQNGYTSGLVYGNFEWMAGFTLVILALFFAPFYLRSKVSTLPDFMEKRFSRGSRDYLAILSIFSAVAVHIGFSLHTGAIVLEGTVLPSMGIENPQQYHGLTILALCAVTAIYTIIGGLLAVVLTESIQTIVLLFGSICITVIGFQMIGGWSELQASVHPVNLSILRSGNDPTGITWYAVFLGYPVLGVWYWCTDQTIVQRVLGAKDENHARIGPLFAGFIKILPVFLFVLPGVICLGLINSGTIPGLPTRADGSPITDQTYTHMIKTMLWPGMQGVVIAALLAALMSTVSGALNSIATLCSYDVYQRFNPKADDRHLIRVGRIATFVAMCVAVIWSMAISHLGETIFQAMLDVFPVVAPPTAVVFLWGVFWRRTSARAALWTLIGGSILGMIMYTMNLLDKFHVIELDDINTHLANFLAINSLFMAFILFVAESVFIFTVSLIWPHQHTEESQKLVWKSPFEALRGENTWSGIFDFRILSALLVVVMVGLYWLFSSSVTYYPLGGTVTLDGKPVVGATVYLDTDDDTLDAQLRTGTDGTYQFATDQRAGGAPEGTVYRVRIVPTMDLIARMKGTEIDEILYTFPAGTAVVEETIVEDVEPESERKAEPKDVYSFTLVTKDRDGDTVNRLVHVSRSDDTKVIRATEIPEKYRDAATSGQEFTVKAEMEETGVDFKLGTE